MAAFGSVAQEGHHREETDRGGGIGEKKEQSVTEIKQALPLSFLDKPGWL